MPASAGTQPGFRLDPSFTAEPASALAALESQLSGIYADLIAYTAPEDVRTGTKSDKPVAAAGSERNWATPDSRTPSCVPNGGAVPCPRCQEFKNRQSYPRWQPAPHRGWLAS